MLTGQWNGVKISQYTPRACSWIRSKSNNSLFFTECYVSWIEMSVFSNSLVQYVLVHLMNVWCLFCISSIIHWFRRSSAWNLAKFRRGWTFLVIIKSLFLFEIVWYNINMLLIFLFKFPVKNECFWLGQFFFLLDSLIYTKLIYRWVLPLEYCYELECCKSL